MCGRGSRGVGRGRGVGCGEAAPGGGETLLVRIEGPGEGAEGVWEKRVLS